MSRVISSCSVGISEQCDNRQRALGEALAQGLALDEFHHHELTAVVFADIEDRADVR